MHAPNCGRFLKTARPGYLCGRIVRSSPLRLRHGLKATTRAYEFQSRWRPSMKTVAPAFPRHPFRSRCDGPPLGNHGGRCHPARNGTPCTRRRLRLHAAKCRPEERNLDVAASDRPIQRRGNPTVQISTCRHAKNYLDTTHIGGGERMAGGACTPWGWESCRFVGRGCGPAEQSGKISEDALPADEVDSMRGREVDALVPGRLG